MAIIALSRLISIPPSSLHSQKHALLQSYAPALLHPCSAALLHSCSPSLLQNSPHTNLHSFPTAFPPFCPFAFLHCKMKRAKLTKFGPNLAPIAKLAQWLEGQFGPLRSVLEYSSQKGSDRYHFDPSKVWIGPNEFYFWTLSQFGPSKSRVRFTNLAPIRCNSWND